MITAARTCGKLSNLFRQRPGSLHAGILAIVLVLLQPPEVYAVDEKNTRIQFSDYMKRISFRNFYKLMLTIPLKQNREPLRVRVYLVPARGREFAVIDECGLRKKHLKNTQVYYGLVVRHVMPHKVWRPLVTINRTLRKKPPHPQRADYKRAYQIHAGIGKYYLMKIEGNSVYINLWAHTSWCDAGNMVLSGRFHPDGFKGDIRVMDFSMEKVGTFEAKPMYNN